MALAGSATGQLTYTVTSTDDGAAAASTVGTLRNAIAQAETDGVASIIEFDPAIGGDTITLEQGQLVINESLTIDGTSAGIAGPGIVISGGWDGSFDYDQNGDGDFADDNGPNNPDDLDGGSPGVAGSRIFLLPGTAPTTPNQTRTFTLRRVHLTEANAGPTGGGANADQDPAASGSSSSNGGCLFVNGGTVNLVDAMLSFSTANDGALVELVDGDLLATGVTFFSARGRDDGAALDIKLGSSADVRNSTFYDNFTGFGGPYSAARAGAVARNDGKLFLEHVTAAYNFTEDGGVIDTRDSLALTNVLLLNNATLVGAGALDIVVDDAASEVTDNGGNYTDEPTSAGTTLEGFTQLTEAEIKLGPLADNGGPTLTCALDCRSDLRGTVTASLLGDQRGETRDPGTNEPGAFEILDCPDTDADALIDFNDDDDDADGITDATELSNAAFETTDISTAAGTGADPSGDTLDLNGVGVAFAKTAGPGSLTVEALASGIQGGGGLKFLSDPQSPGETQVFTLEFADPVYGLGFKIADLDDSTAIGVDQVSITLFAEDKAFAITEASPSVTVGSNVNSSGSRFTASSGPAQDPESGVDGTVTITNLPFRVTRIELSFEPGLVSGDPSARDFFLTDLTFRSPTAIDPDGDGLPAPLDIDADGDGIVDNAEAQTEALYDATETDLTPIDTDGDAVPDFLDLDSDDDGEFDVIEGHDMNNDGFVDAADEPTNPAGTGIPTGIDVDGDGLDDGYDNETDVLGSGNSSNFAGPATYADTDNVGDPNSEGNWRDDDANVAGYVFADADEDGFREEGEGGVSGAIVKLYADGGTDPLATRTVDSTGRYLFSDIKDVDSVGFGVTDFFLEFEPPAGQNVPVPYNAGGDAGDTDRFDSDYTDQAGVFRTVGTFTVGESQPAAFIGAGFGEAVLPVEFVSISAGVSSNCSATVAWTVASEIDVDRYVVERLVGEEWVADAEVLATGASAYDAVATAAGAYYRVTSVDLDGSRGSSDIVVADACVEGAASASARPNPASGGVAVAFSWATTPQRAVTIHDAAGRTVATLAPQVGSLLQTAELPTGIYVARNGAETVRFVVR